MGFFSGSTTLPFIAIIFLGAVKCRALDGEPPSPSNLRHNFFDIELFESLVNSNSNENVLVSPLSVKLLLGMLLEGTHGEAAAEVRTALRLPLDVNIARDVFRKWISSLNTSQLSKLLVATQMFVDDKINPVLGYKEILENYYGGGVSKVTFGDSATAADKINTWVRGKTNKLIEMLVTPQNLSPNTKAILTSAVYFKANWLYPFNKNKTTISCFTLPSGQCRKTSFMVTSERLKYAYISTLDAQALEIPYQDPRFTMLVLLPRGTMTGLSRDLVFERLPQILSQLRTQEVFLQFPKFEMTMQKDLLGVLRHLRVSEVFGPQADFRKMFLGNNSLVISNVLHSAKIIVNEDGSEAAASTGAVFVPLMGSISTRFIADKPFLFYICDAINNNIVFAGRLSAPDSVREHLSSEHILPASFGELDALYAMPPPVRKTPVRTQPYAPQLPGRPDTYDKQKRCGEEPVKRKEAKNSKRSSPPREQIYFRQSN